MITLYYVNANWFSLARVYFNIFEWKIRHFWGPKIGLKNGRNLGSKTPFFPVLGGSPGKCEKMHENARKCTKMPIFRVFRFF
jgi:hypothetical protein